MGVVILLFLLVPVIPFLLAGPWLESRIALGVKSLSSPTALLTGTALALLVDIFLPVPSSAVITYAGAQCGIFPTTLAATLGLTLGSGLGYELSRWWGPWLLKRFSVEEDTRRMHHLAGRWGGTALVLTRPLPILGETAVLMAGCLQLNRWLFYSVVLVANLVVAAVYASFGSLWRDEQALPWVLGVSLIVPLLLTFCLRHQLKRAAQTGDAAENR